MEFIVAAFSVNVPLYILSIIWSMPSTLIIGLGYVGLPVALRLASTKKYKVTGFDLSQEKIKAIQQKTADWISPSEQALLKNTALTVTSNAQDLSTYDTILLCVPTPVNQDSLPDLVPVMQASQTAAQHLRPQGLLVLESTVNPGVCEEIIAPILEQAGRRLGKTAFLAHCPERIDPGNDNFPLHKIPRVLGTDSPKGRKKAHAFYTSFLDAPVHTVSSLKAAEASKIVENAFRDINIAFVNELAQSFSRFGIDVTEVIDAASTKPFGFLPHYPGAGVGGHCIPVDPYYLIESARTKGFEHRFLRLAREINTGMPAYTVGLLEDGLKKAGLNTKTAKVTLLGLSYKPGIADQRNSPALEIRTLLEKKYPHLTVFDPYVPESSTVSSLQKALKHADAVLIATAHPEFVRALNTTGTQRFPSLKLIVDGRNCLKKWPAQVQYRGIGR